MNKSPAILAAFLVGALGAGAATVRYTTNLVAVSNVLELNGRLYDRARVESRTFRIESVLSPTSAIAIEQRTRVWWTGPTVAKGIGIYGPRDRNTERVDGPAFVLLNTPKQPAIGEFLTMWGAESGTTNLGGGRIYNVFARGSQYYRPVVTATTIYTPDELAAQAAGMEAKVVAHQLRNATNGLPYAQYELGLRYLRGDGVESNRALAMHWLRSACTNGHAQASNALASARLP